MPAGTPEDSVSLTIDATPAALYELVSDVTKMGRLSPECTGGRWLGRAKGPTVGARFVGFNRRGIVWWCTLNKVVIAEPGCDFAFATGGSGIRWRYRFKPTDGVGTVVTESREEWKPRPLSARLFTRFALGGVPEHEDEMRDGMRATLERLRQLAEK